MKVFLKKTLFAPMAVIIKGLNVNTDGYLSTNTIYSWIVLVNAIYQLTLSLGQFQRHQHCAYQSCLVTL